MAGPKDRAVPPPDGRAQAEHVAPAGCSHRLGPHVDGSEPTAQRAQLRTRLLTACCVSFLKPMPVTFPCASRKSNLLTQQWSPDR